MTAIKYQQIVADMRARFATSPTGTRLPAVSRLAEHYNVSRSTIHRATEALEQEGVMARLPGRGMFIVDIRGAGVPEGVTPAGAVEASLRLRIAALPHGADLPTIVEMAREYGVSQVTVRRTLNKLVAEGRLTHRRPRFRVWRT